MRFLQSAGPETSSFRYDAAPWATLLPTWQRESTAPRLSETAPGIETQQTIYRDPVTGLAVTATARTFAGFPAVEWVLELTNEGATEIPIIEDLLPLDARLPLPAQERLRLHHPHGSLCQMDDFLPQVTELPPGVQVTVAPRGGRSSNGAFPFANQ
jgi:alpha-galactosidase